MPRIPVFDEPATVESMRDFKPVRSELAIEIQRRSLSKFMRAGWPAVEPNKLRWGWHNDAICDHLEAVTWGQIKRLLLIIPPNASKSITVGTFWPAWEWLTNPSERWLFFSNAENLALEESMRCRRLIESEWYREEFDIPWELRDDQDTKQHYQNTMGGGRKALGFSANTTGAKGHKIVIDDANDAEKVHSQTERKRINRKYDNAISDRHIDLNNGATVIVGQRTHVADLIGHVDAQGGWEKLILKEEYRRAKTFTTCIGWQDPRTVEGELLRPLDLGPSAIRAKRRANLMGYQAKHMAEPRSEEGTRFKLHYFNKRWRFDADPNYMILEDERGVYRVGVKVAFNVRSRFGTVDPATSANESADWTVSSAWIYTTRGDLVWLACERMQAELPEQVKRVMSFHQRWSLDWTGIEAVFSNRNLYQEMRRERIICRELSPRSRDKLARAVGAIVLAESGRVWLPDATAATLSGFPLVEVLDELTSFTGNNEEDQHEDTVDTLSYAAEYINGTDTGPGGGAAPSAIPIPPANNWQTQPIFGTPLNAKPTKPGISGGGVHPTSTPTRPQ